MDGTIENPQPKVSFIARTQRDQSSRALAKHAIELLEKRIFDDFGVHVKMGAELEFAVSLRQGNPYFQFQTNPAFGLKGKQDAANVGTDPSLIRDEPEKCPQFPDSTRIAYGYIDENGISDSWDTLEFILTHEPCDAQGLPTTRPMHALAREIDALIKQVCQPALGYKNPPDGFDHQEQVAHWQRFGREQVKEIRARSYLPEENMAFGLHLNFSLWDAKGHSWNLRKDHREFANQMHESTCRLFAENMPLISESPTSEKRMQSRFTNQGTPAFEHHHVGHASNGYYENKICGIETDPYYAVMLQLAAIYEGLNQFRASTPEIMDEHEEVSPRISYLSRRLGLAVSMPEQHRKQDFLDTKQNALISLLNGLESGLGARFMQAHSAGKNSVSVVR